MGTNTNDPKQQAYTQSGQKMQDQAASSPQALVKRHADLLNSKKAQIEKWITQGVKAESLIRFALLDVQSNQKLRECDPTTIYMSLLACAVTGLEPGALKGEAYLVPFAGKAQFMPGWKGLVKQMRRTREIIGVVANVVCEADTFDMDLGTANVLIHKPALKERGNVIGAYAIAKMASGHHELEFMDLEDLEAVKKVATSRSKSPAWENWEDQMQRKSVIRRLAKRLPLGMDYFVAMQLEQSDDQRMVIDMETMGAATEAERQASVSASMRKQAIDVSVEPEPIVVVDDEETPAATTEAKPEAKAEPKAEPVKAEPAKKAAPKPEAAVKEMPPAKEAPKAEPAKTAPPLVLSPQSMDDYEERACVGCGDAVTVLKTTPKKTQKCDSCKSEDPGASPD